MTAYEQAAPASKQLVDTLHHELSILVPATNRHDAASQTTFGATGYSKFIFAYPSKSKERLLVFFLGNADEPPSQLAGMPTIKIRNNLNSDWAKITPFSATLNHRGEVAPFARFLIDYSRPRAISKRGNLARKAKVEITLPEEVPAEFFSEGHAMQITVNRYERDPQARRACLQLHGTKCAGCGISMEAVYGDIAHGFIHVHHLVPLSHRKNNYAVNPKLDLIPLCPNCHAVTHLANPPLSLEQLKCKIIKS